MDIGDVPIIVGEITNIFGVMNDDSKRNSSLEMAERRAFATCWTTWTYAILVIWGCADCRKARHLCTVLHFLLCIQNRFQAGTGSCRSSNLLEFLA